MTSQLSGVADELEETELGEPVYHWSKLSSSSDGDGRSWLWFFDMERMCSLLVGRLIYGMGVDLAVIDEERQAQRWLGSHLFGNGLESISSDLKRQSKERQKCKGSFF